MESKKNYENYLKLAQLQNFFHNSHEVDKIESILKSGYDINYALTQDDEINYEDNFSNLSGFTALHFAVEMLQDDFFLSIINLLFSFGADLTLKNANGYTPLHEALRNIVYDFDFSNSSNFKAFDLDFQFSVKENFQKINQLLDVFVNSFPSNPCSKEGISHLHIACITNNVEAIKLLCKQGISVDETINAESTILPKHTPLSIAIRNRNTEIVKLLLDYGADYKASFNVLADKEINNDFLSKVKSDIQDSNDLLLCAISERSKDGFNIPEYIGMTQLHIFCIKNQYEDLEDYLKCNKNINATVHSDSPIWPLYTPLHFAAINSLKMVKLLLINGADLMAKDTNEITPLDLCLEKYKPSEISSILLLLYDIGMMEPITFNNNAKLIKILNLFDTYDDLLKYLEIFGNNNTISLPFDSPIFSGYSLLHLAVIFSKNNDSLLVELCLNFDTDFTVQNAHKMSALHLAFRLKKKKCVEEILKAHIDNYSNPIDDKKISHFHIACAAGNYEIMKMFLNHGVDPDLPIHPESRIFFKSYYKDYFYPDGTNGLRIGSTALLNCFDQKMVELLLDHKADFNIQDDDGFTWIHRFFLSGCFEDYCIKNRIFIKMLSNTVAPANLTDLHVACATGNLKVVKKLLKTTTSNNIINQSLTRELKAYVKNLPSDFCLGDTPLHLAVRGGFEKIISVLLKKDADVHAKNDDGSTALHEALKKMNNKTVIQKLTSKYFENKKIEDEHGLTALHVAVALKNLSQIKKLLKSTNVYSKIKSDSPIWPDCTCLHINDFKHNNNLDVLNLFFNHIFMKIANFEDQELCPLNKLQMMSIGQEKKVTKELEKFYTLALHISCKKNIPDVIEKFLKSGFININSSSSNLLDIFEPGFTALHYAVKYCNDDTIEMLLKYGADVTIENSECQTPFHLAAADKNPNKFKFFLREYKDHINVTSTCGQSPFDVFLETKYNDDDYIEFLKIGLAKAVDLKNKLRLVRKFVKIFSPKFFETILEYVPNLNDVDSNGRNVIHYIGQSEFYDNDACIDIDDMGKNIEFLEKKGCDIDLKDASGNTPLHLASRSKNLFVIRLLLSVGADVNITDDAENTAFDIIQSNKSINLFLYKLDISGLYINNYETWIDRDEIDEIESNNVDIIEKSSHKMKLHYITESLTLRAFFTEKIIMKFPMMSLKQQQAIIDYVDASTMKKIFPEWISIYKYQLRKALKRKKLLTSIVNSFDDLISLPVHCVENILKYLNNNDWYNIAKAVENL